MPSESGSLQARNTPSPAQMPALDGNDSDTDVQRTPPKPTNPANPANWTNPTNLAKPTTLLKTGAIHRLEITHAKHVNRVLTDVDAPAGTGPVPVFGTVAVEADSQVVSTLVAFGFGVDVLTIDFLWAVGVRLSPTDDQELPDGAVRVPRGAQGRRAGRAAQEAV